MTAYVTLLFAKENQGNCFVISMCYSHFSCSNTPDGGITFPDVGYV